MADARFSCRLVPTCLEMRNMAFADPRVRAALSALTLVQADMTEEGTAAWALLGRFGLIGSPAIVFFDPDRRERKSLRIVGYMDSEALLAQIKRLAG